MSNTHLFDCDGSLYDTRAADWHKKTPLRAIYSQLHPCIENTLQLRACLRNGDARVFFICSDGGVLSRAAVLQEYRLVSEAIRSQEFNSGWKVVGCADVSVLEELTYCEHTNSVIYDPS